MILTECLLTVLFGFQDAYGAERKEKLQNELSLYRCHTIFNCAYPSLPPSSFPQFFYPRPLLALRKTLFFATTTSLFTPVLAVLPEPC